MHEPGAIDTSDQNDLALEPGYDDHKTPGAFRTIGEVARALGIRQHVLRYWEEQFPMLSPLKRSGNRRLYRPADVQLIETIDRLVHHQGYTLRGARLALEAQAAIRAASPVPEIPAPVIRSDATPMVDAPAEADARPLWAELQMIRASLAAALDG